MTSEKTGPDLSGYEFPERLANRISKYVQMDGDCWRWRGGSRVRGGYVQIRDGSGTKKLAHRIVYESAVGEIAQGMQLDHLCRTPDCCNPEHLEQVTAQENLRRRSENMAADKLALLDELASWRERALCAEAALAGKEG